jgi:hypothetical protein
VSTTASARTHAVVVGFRSEDQRRYRMIPPATIRSGRCVGCRAEVFLNELGTSAVTERDADVICVNCDAREGVHVDRDMIES